MDGALFHNNPIRVANLERKLIWPDTMGSPPDLLLSIGTSCNDGICEEASKAESKGDIALTVSQMGLGHVTQVQKSKSKMKQLLKLFKARLGSILDTEIAWRDFMADTTNGTMGIGERYQRINPNIRMNPPALHEAPKLLDLQSKVRSVLENDGPLRKKTKEIAHRLVASSFYFEKSPGPSSPRMDELVFSGKLEIQSHGSISAD